MPSETQATARPQTYLDLESIFRDVFFRDDISLSAETTAKDIEGWDSFRQVEIILAVQERFQIKISSRDMDALKSVGDLVAVIERGLGYPAAQPKVAPAAPEVPRERSPEQAPSAKPEATPAPPPTAHDSPARALEVIDALARERRNDEALAAAIEARKTFPNSARVLLTCALLHERAKNQAEAVEVLLDGCKRLPNYDKFFVQAARGLRRLGRFDEAERVALDGAARFPARWEPLAEFALAAQGLKDLVKAEAAWLQVRDRFPDVPIGYWRAALVLSQAGKLDEAEAVIDDAVRKFPHHPEVLWQWGVSATRRDDTAEAMRRWLIGSERCPDSRAIANGLANLRMALQERAGLDGDEDGYEETPFERGKPPVLPPDVFPADQDLGEFLLGFESLGDNCEFGVVQRIAGVEPVGLLRWGGISISNLTEMLNARFDGVGAPNFVQLRLNDRGKYSLRDPRYFAMHTFIDQGHMPEPALREIMVRRVAFLRDKLISDLEEGAKIFVYKSRQTQTIEEVLALHRAMQRFGPSSLLYVQKDIMNELNDTVVKVAEGVVCASLPKITKSPHGARDYFEDWVRLLSKAHRMLKAPVAPS